VPIPLLGEMQVRRKRTEQKIVVSNAITMEADMENASRRESECDARE
jgi:hypothetical protein